MTGHIYRDVILEQHVRLFRGAMGTEFLFMDDNARPHRANIVDERLQSKDITRMDWPACSLDLKPIEHVWYMLGRRIATRQPPPTCLPDFQRALLGEWRNIPQDQIDNLILSMPRRCLWLGTIAIDSIQGIAEFDRLIQRDDNRQHGDDDSPQNMRPKTTFSSSNSQKHYEGCSVKWQEKGQ
ncbi:transposable element Tcb1 transposase [Trichonephila clavipes]|nr:transposable element Tcb1 transposase [Trichonephila clavipes]